jgi:hypothetical protein
LRGLWGFSDTDALGNFNVSKFMRARSHRNGRTG